MLPKAVLCKDVREVLTQVELGNVDAGIVYRTDALTANNLRIAATAPAKLHKPILYPAAVVADSKNRTAAAAYAVYGGAAGEEGFRKYGFLAVKS